MIIFTLVHSMIAANSITKILAHLWTNQEIAKWILCLTRPKLTNVSLAFYLDYSFKVLKFSILNDKK